MSQKMVNLAKPVRIYVNNILKFDGRISRKLTQMTKLKVQEANPNLNYSTYVDLKL